MKRSITALVASTLAVLVMGTSAALAAPCQKITSGKTVCHVSTQTIQTRKTLAKKIMLAKIGGFDLMYQIWRALNRSEGFGLSIDHGKNAKPFIDENILRSERAKLVRSRLPMLEKTIRTIRQTAIREEFKTSGKNRQAWHTIAREGSNAAKALRQLAAATNSATKADDADSIYGAQSLAFADAVYEMDAAQKMLRLH